MAAEKSATCTREPQRQRVRLSQSEPRGADTANHMRPENRERWPEGRRRRMSRLRQGKGIQFSSVFLPWSTSPRWIACPDSSCKRGGLQWTCTFFLGVWILIIVVTVVLPERLSLPWQEARHRCCYRSLPWDSCAFCSSAGRRVLGAHPWYPPDSSRGVRFGTWLCHLLFGCN